MLPGAIARAGGGRRPYRWDGVQVSGAEHAAARGAADAVANGSKNAAFMSNLQAAIGAGFRRKLLRNGVVVWEATVSGSVPLVGGAFVLPSSATLVSIAAADIDTGTWIHRIEHASNPAKYIATRVTRVGGGGPATLSGDLEDGGSVGLGAFTLYGPSLDVSSSTDYVDTLVDDMALFHDGPGDTLTPIPGWGSGANFPEAYAKDPGWTHGIMWFHMMEDTSNLTTTDASRAWRVPGPYTGNGGENTRAQVRDLQIWTLSSAGVWTLRSSSVSPGGAMYPTNWNEGVDIYNTTLRSEASNGGGASVRDIGRGTYEDHVWHGFTSPFEMPTDYVAIASAFYARKILDNPSGTDDRASARLLAAGAGDYYESAGVANGTIPKTVGGNVRPMGYGRLKYLSNDWQLFSFYSTNTLTQSALRANPPPFLSTDLLAPDTGGGTDPAPTGVVDKMIADMGTATVTLNAAPTQDWVLGGSVIVGGDLRDSVTPSWWGGPSYPEYPLWTFLLPWYVVWDVSGHQDNLNVRCNIADLQLWVLTDASPTTWQRLAVSAGPAGDPYSRTLIGGSSGNATGRAETDGTYSVKVSPTGSVFHGYAASSSSFNPAQVIGLQSRMRVRKILETAGGADQRSLARYAVQVGLDAYPYQGAPLPSVGYWPGTVSSRFTEVTNDWGWIYATTVAGSRNLDTSRAYNARQRMTDAAFRATPPPAPV